MTATETHVRAVAEHCPTCGRQLGEWFGRAFVVNHKGRIVRVLSGEIDIPCPHCGEAHHLIIPSLDAMPMTT